MESRRVFFVAHVLSLLPSRVSSLVSQKKLGLGEIFLDTKCVRSGRSTPIVSLW